MSLQILPSAVSHFEMDQFKLSWAVAQNIRSTSSAYSALCCMEQERGLLGISVSTDTASIPSESDRI